MGKKCQFLVNYPFKHILPLQSFIVSFFIQHKYNLFGTISTGEMIQLLLHYLQKAWLVICQANCSHNRMLSCFHPKHLTSHDPDDCFIGFWGSWQQAAGKVFFWGGVLNILFGKKIIGFGIDSTFDSKNTASHLKQNLRGSWLNTCRLCSPPTSSEKQRDWIKYPLPLLIGFCSKWIFHPQIDRQKKPSQLQKKEEKNKKPRRATERSGKKSTNERPKSKRYEETRADRQRAATIHQLERNYPAASSLVYSYDTVIHFCLIFQNAITQGAACWV